MPYRILVADDEPGFRDLLQKALSLGPCIVDTAGDGQEALDLLCQGHFDLAVLDILMPRPDGLEVLRDIREKGIQTDVIVLTGHGSTDLAVEAMKLGARDFVEKQKLNLPEFVAAVRRLLESRHLPPHVVADWLDAYLKDHAFERSLKFSGLCKHFGISSSYAARLFHKHIGEPYHTRLASYRVQKARRLLETSDDPLYLIADQCGFKNYRQLTKAFYKQEGVLPRTYRKICREKRTK